MGDPKGFLKFERADLLRQPVAERVKHSREFETHQGVEELRRQGARCMDCGIPFCHSGCPLGNLIPEWNDDVYAGRFRDAIAKLHQTNNFPEITGRVCPAPCEDSCVLAINSPAVAIKQIELFISEAAFGGEFFAAKPPVSRSGRRVAVVGSGPAGLAAAMELNHAGHTVTVFERADRLGGLLRYGIPDFKLEKRIIDRRLEQMRCEGVRFKTGIQVGVDVPAQTLSEDFHAALLACGAPQARDLPLPGRDLAGVHLAMDFLIQQNRRVAGDTIPEAEAINAAGKQVVVLGGGDTGSDCVGTAIRRGAKSVTQLEILPKPPPKRTSHNPWPQWANVLRTSSSQAEGCERDWWVNTKAFEGSDGKVEALRYTRVQYEPDADGKLRPREVTGSEQTMPAQLVLLALGFVGQEPNGLVEHLGVPLDATGNIATDQDMRTGLPGIFAAGDSRRGQSLVVWAIAEGRRAALEIDRQLRA